MVTQIKPLSEDTLAKRKMEETAGAMAAASMIPLPKPLTISDIPNSTLSPLVAIGNAKQKSPLPSPDQPQASKGSPLLFRKIDEISLKKPEDKGKKPIEDLLYDVIWTVLETTKDTTSLKKEILEAENTWQITLRKNITENLKKQNDWERRSTLIERISKTFGSLFMLGAGIFSLVTGGVGVLAIGAAAIGGLLFLDSVLDDVLKKQAATFLARGKEESKDAWLSRIQLFCTIATIGLSLGVNAGALMNIASRVSDLALQGIKMGTDWRTEAAQVITLELTKDMKLSESKIDSVLRDVEGLQATVENLYKTLHQVQKSHNQANTFIFS